MRRLKLLLRQPPLGAQDRLFIAVAAVLAALLAGFPLVGSSYTVTVVRDALIFGLLALSLDFFWGRTNLLSFGHSVFFGLGAYAMAVVTLDVGGSMSSIVGIVIAVGLATLMAGLLGLFLFFGGVRGAYFTIVTLALSLILQQTAISWVSVTGGDSGRIGVPPLTVELFGASYTLGTGLGLYYLCFAVSVAALAATFLAFRGPYGNILKAIADDEQRARALGYNTSFYILVNFMISGGLGGLAGALYVTGSGYIAPDSVGLLLSTEVIVWVVAGGRGTLLGPFVGAFIVLRVQQEISSLHPSLWPLILGLSFVGIVFLFPEGMLPLLRRLVIILWRRKEGGAAGV